MKVAFNNTIFFQQRFGGISRYFTCLAKELINKNIDLKIIAPIYKNQYLKNIPKKNRLGIYISRYPQYKILELYSNLILKKVLNKEKPNIVHDTYYSKNIILPPGSKKILTIYDLIHEKFSDLYSEDFYNFKKKAISNCDHFICISNKTKSDFMNFYNIPESKISVIYFGVEHMLNLKKNIKLQNNKQKPFLLYVGSRLKYKNFKIIVDVFSKSKKLQNDFNVVCFGGGKFNNEEIKNFKNFNIKKNFMQINGSDNLLARLYLNAKALIFTSLYEGFGLPLIEAMSLGCPIISSNTSSMPEICDEAAEYFNPNDADDLVNKLEDVLYKDSKLKEFIHKGLEKANQFKWEKCANETLSLYRNL